MNETLAAGVAVVAGNGGLKKIIVANTLAQAEIYLLGATVTDYEPAGQEPVLFVSDNAAYEVGKAIRGGIPVCWPWFGPHPTDPKQPQHGPVRRMEWMFAGSETLVDGGTRVALELTLPYASLWYDVTVGRSLITRLSSTNTSAEPMNVTEALHTYLRVGGIRQISIEGLDGVEYAERTVPGRFRQDDPVIRFAGEVDRQYFNTASPVTLVDPKLYRSIRVSKRGSNTTVVWNPWARLAKAMTDLGDDEYTSFVCIETANSGENAVTIGPGQSHEIESEVTVV
jgi:glucose-6-phosphate 1-epimerase